MNHRNVKDEADRIFMHIVSKFQLFQSIDAESGHALGNSEFVKTKNCDTVTIKQMTNMRHDTTTMGYARII